MERKINGGFRKVGILILIKLILAIGIMSYIYDLEKKLNVNLDMLKIIFSIFIITGLCINIFIFKILRTEIVHLSDRVIFIINSIIAKNDIEFNLNKETLVSKIEGKFKLLFERFEAINKSCLSEKESVKGLIGDISHQVKTPMANIKIYNETMISRELSKLERDKFLVLMGEQIEKIDWLTKGLVKLSRLETGAIDIKSESNSLKDTIASIIGQVYIKTMDRDIEIEVDFEDDINIYYDKKWTEEAIYNIVDNAVKYSDEESIISIKVEKGDIFTCISIENQGIGIKIEDLNNIFKRFFRCESSRNIEGVGVGLYLSRDIVERQGGFIKVESVYGKHTKFSIYLLNSK
ncbi:sensor histidine kinase KdpD [uncultured Clostridium sp.]|uniref:sensor histidine kinase n=1 Tax=uncultured Clostridium sp. TaxID=59620 RepID=UPI002630F6F4|nr:HAMP domain-containing sensor histidine kinase [uncultured Clostridium sp.]